MNKPLMREKTKSDYLGIISSTFCAIHCAFTPFILAALSAVKSAEETWVWLDYIFIALCLWAVFHSSKHTNSKKIRKGLWTAWVLFAIGILFEDAAEGISYVGYAGSLALVLLHIINIQHFKTCEKCGQ